MKSIIKKLNLIFILFLLVITVAACNNGNGSGSTEDTRRYTITYQLDEGHFEGSVPTECTKDSVFDLPVPVKDGYTFVGWYHNDTLVTNLSSILENDSNIILHARWSKIIENTLNANLSKDYLHLGDEASLYIEGHFDTSALDIQIEGSSVEVDTWLNVISKELGTSTITIVEKANPNKKAVIEVEVIGKNPQILTISNRVSVGDKLYFNIKNLDELVDSSISDYEWSINDFSLATINDDNSLTALKEGTITLTVTSKKDARITSSTFVDVVNKDELAVLATPDNNYIYKEGDLISLEILGKQASNSFVWSSSDLEVLRVREDGLIIAVTSGSATISVYQENNTKNRTFYEITVLENTNNNIDYIGNLLTMAFSQNGYREGTNNDNKFGIWYNNNHQPWCAMFVSWCWYQTGLSNDLLLKYQGCSTGQEWCIEKGIFKYKENYTPKPGDIIFFEGHTGICAYVEGEYMYTIEGNASNRVGVWRWALNNSRIIGYATPDYPEYNGTPKDFSFLAGKDANGNYYWTNASGNQSTT